jgi:ABC-type multidrug transport system fused ATPase/permease subunit
MLEKTILKRASNMDSQLLKINVGILMFEGLSSQIQRLIALISTVIILAVTSLALVQLARVLEMYNIADQVAFIIAVSVLVHYILTGKFAFNILSHWVVRHTPFGVLYRNDMRVLDAAKAQLQAFADRVHFTDFESYTRINPYISIQGCLEITSHQSKGDLQQWLSDVKNLKIMSDLVFQLWIVERSIAAGDYTRP